MVASNKQSHTAAKCAMVGLAVVLSVGNPLRAATQQDDQRLMLDHVALAIAAYRASADECYYDPKDGKIFDDADALFTRRLPEVWPRLRDSAPDSLPALRNTARLIGATSDCVAFGNAVGLGLIAALYTGQLDASVGTEMDRLTKGGGRGKSDPVPAGPPAPPPRSAAETNALMNAAKAESDASAARARAVLAAEPTYPGYRAQGFAVPGQQAITGPDHGAPIGGVPAQPVTPVTPVTASGVAQEPALSDCLQSVDPSRNKNGQVARCYASALSREDKRLNDELSTLKGRIYDPEKLSALAQAQHVWIDFRDRWCSYESKLDEAASPEIGRLSCLVGITSDQADRLATSYLP